MFDTVTAGPAQPRGTVLHLVSSLDDTAAEISDRMAPNVHRILIIETARLAEGRSFAPEETLPFEDFGYDTLLCCAEQETSDSLEAKMRSADACLLLGGNTFSLMKALEDVEFDELIRRKALSSDPQPFHIIGESAGAVAMGTTITHVASMDDPTVPTRRTDRGLSWVDARVLPHRGCPHWGFGEAVEKVITSDQHPDSLMILDEDQLLTIPAI